MSLHYVPEITNGVLLSRLGDVHKLPLCHTCYPNHHGPGGRYAAHR